MLTKRVLLEMVIELSSELEGLEDRIDTLEREVRKPKPIKRGENVDGVKRKPGRPKKQK